MDGRRALAPPGEFPRWAGADPHPPGAQRRRDGELTTFEREDGETQVAANGWPLYYFAPDEEPGDATGQGVNGVWWVLDTDGEPIRESN